MMRPSTEARIETAATIGVIGFVGLFLMLAGAFGAYLGYREATIHTAHVAIGAGVCVFGALVLLIGVAQKPGETVLQRIVIIVSPFVPRFGGRRAEDQAITNELHLPPPDQKP